MEAVAGIHMTGAAVGQMLKATLGTAQLSERTIEAQGD
jgi:hypothetical protein